MHRSRFIGCLCLFGLVACSGDRAFDNTIQRCIETDLATGACIECQAPFDGPLTGHSSGLVSSGTAGGRRSVRAAHRARCENLENGVLRGVSQCVTIG